MTYPYSYKYLIVIQARLTSHRFPNKIMETVGGIPIVKRVWLAAREAARVIGYTKVVVAWPERFPHLDENNVLGRFRELVKEFNPQYVIRLTADCPLLTPIDIEEAVRAFEKGDERYYSNHKDGYDVQVFNPYDCSIPFHNEHVLADFETKSTGYSVNTKEDLERVRRLCRTK